MYIYFGLLKIRAWFCFFICIYLQMYADTLVYKIYTFMFIFIYNTYIIYISRVIMYIHMYNGVDICAQTSKTFANFHRCT